MRYIITESQYNILSEDVPSFVKRRLTELNDLVREYEVNYENLCEDFLDADEYANRVIAGAMGKFMMDNITELSDFKDYVFIMDKMMHKENYDRLVNIYNEKCSEYND